MIYTEEYLSEITRFGELNYSMDKIIKIDYPNNRLEWISDFNNPESELHIAYEKGIVIARYKVANGLYDIAKDGDVDAIKLREELKKNEEIEELIKDRFNV